MQPASVQNGVCSSFVLTVFWQSVGCVQFDIGKESSVMRAEHDRRQKSTLAGLPEAGRKYGKLE